MWIQREIEPLLEAEARQWPVTVLTGARQAGKTSVLKRVLPARSYVTLDLPRSAEQAEEAGEAFLAAHPPPILVDEIQYAPAMLRHIKAFVDARHGVNDLFALTGSQKFQLMQGVTESLAGRVSIIDCHSLSVRELEPVYNKAMEGDFLLQMIFLGGYPRLHAQGVDPERFFNNYVATYLERDVRQVLQVRSLRDFDRFLRLAATRCGQLVSANGLAADVGVATGTIKAWLSVLESSNVITLLRPYHRNLGKRLVKTPKLYFLDTGLACYLAGLRSPAELRRSALLGAIFETHVVGQLIRHAANRGRDPRLYFYRDAHGREVDLVMAIGEKVHLMECKFNSQAPLSSPGFAELRKLMGDDVLSQTVITSGRGYHVTGSGIGRGDSLSFDYLEPLHDPAST